MKYSVGVIGSHERNPRYILSVIVTSDVRVGNLLALQDSRRFVTYGAVRLGSVQ
jgi:hypothetical protein